MMVDFIKKVSIDLIAKAMFLEKGISGLYRCRRFMSHTDNEKFVGTIHLCKDGNFYCKCGLSGKDFISLYSKIYKISYNEASRFLVTRILKLNNEKPST